LRDRGFVYWRLLSTDPEAAHKVVLAQRPPITDDTYQIDAQLLDTLISNISTLSAVYHKPAESFVKGGKSVVFSVENDEEEQGSDEDDDEENSSSSADDEDVKPSKKASSKSGTI
jgi:AP-1 complex subunit beta-1